MTTTLSRAQQVLGKPHVIPAPGGHWAGSLVPHPAHKLESGIKTRWLKDLRSGSIPQARNTLRRKLGNGRFGYCCVGVFCNAVSHRKDWFSDNDGGPNEFGWRKFGARAVFELADVKGFPDSKTLSFLASLNDNGATFLQIADWVEKYL